METKARLLYCNFENLNEKSKLKNCILTVAWVATITLFRGVGKTVY